jgi:hypothetical protein
MTFEFADPKLEKIVALTASDRRWMDDVVRTVEETYELPEGERSSSVFPSQIFSCRLKKS